MTSAPPVFVEPDFRKASASQPNKECVCIARAGGRVELRDDKKAFGAADDARLIFTEAQFDAFLAGVRSGRATNLCLKMVRDADGMYSFTSAVPQPLGQDVTLRFTEGEVLAFVDGIVRNEFDRGGALNAPVPV